jgi:hypothetical protein
MLFGLDDVLIESLAELFQEYSAFLPSELFVPAINELLPLLLNRFQFLDAVAGLTADDSIDELGFIRCDPSLDMDQATALESFAMPALLLCI